MDVLSFFQKVNDYFKNNPKNVSFVWGYCFFIIICCLDCQVHPKISLSILYLFPVSLITWFVSKEAGFVASGLSTIAGFVSKSHSETIQGNTLVTFWNATVMLIVFLTVSSLLLRLRDSLQQEQRLARNDRTTEVANKRLFLELAEREVRKVQRYRHPLTVINLDIDDFKKFNHKFGRKVGDQLLYIAAQALKNSIRDTDIIGRICDDEFVILLPGIGYELSHSVICRVKSQLLKTMENNQWSVTFSIAAVTFINPPETTDEMLQQADHLMYLVKNNGKNQLKHKTATVA
jgi:diguanylate cyclase (GGDEF)-like protein